jgi:transcriptional regulator with XRE-family HTH domain
MSATRTFSSTRLRQLREASGYSREQVAVAIRRSWNAVYQYERAETLPGREAQEALAALLDCRIDDFYEDGSNG